MPSGGGGGSGGHGGGWGGYGSGNAATSAHDFGGMGGMAAGLSGTSGEFIGWPGYQGQRYPWEVDPQDPFGIPKEFAGYELQGGQLQDTRGYMTPQGQSMPLNPDPISAMIPNMRGGEMLDPRFVGMDQRNQGQQGAMDARGMLAKLLAG
jgi:hypothetical protein